MTHAALDRRAVGALLCLLLAAAPLVTGERAGAADPVNAVTVRLAVAQPANGLYGRGRSVAVSGTVFGTASHAPTAASFFLRVVAPDGSVRGPFGPYSSDPATGSFTATLPGRATAGIEAGADSGYRAIAAVEMVELSYLDAEGTTATSDRAARQPLVLAAAPKGLTLENSFVSSVGWVKPGAAYTGRVFVRNFSKKAFPRVTVRVGKVSGMAFRRGTPSSKSGKARVRRGSIVWNVGKVPPAAKGNPTVKTLIVEARANSLKRDPKVVWKDLSTTAVMSFGKARRKSVSHGPKVIPPGVNYDTARYGDRPFPVVPVDYFDRNHTDDHSGKSLANVINSPKVTGSTFNLYQEMSYKQLFPHGTVPSADIETAGWDVEWKSDRHKTQSWALFSDLAPQGSCHGVTNDAIVGTPAYPERITGGWYQLPGTTDYYGDDRYGSGLIGALAGVGPIFTIDDACGPTGKAVYDAALIADPEIDYSDYDTDKDGVVDFFMMVYVGLGGHGASQLDGQPPYDNIWPHSSSLEFYYTDAETGQSGYISDDQLKDYRGRKLYYTSATRLTMTTKKTKFPVYVRVGPYNVNPESAVDKASVISHEYGHSLGLPDFYSLGNRGTYGDWNLMATDKSQNMDVFSKQELGWLVPRVLQPNKTTTVKNWRDSKNNTHRINWKTPRGRNYVLKGKRVNNGQGYVAKLPPRQVIDPGIVEADATPYHVWWSTSGNDFGCVPEKGRNLDIFLPELERVEPGETVTVSFKSHWEIEWDYDYGFVMYSTDAGKTYTSLASTPGYTTPGPLNPNANPCQQRYGNGITGSNGSYEATTQVADRGTGSYPAGGFVEDSYDLSAAAGAQTVLRFTYSTDPGLARPGWFIDDLVVTAGSKVIYKSNFEKSKDNERVFPGGCKGTLRVADSCTDGWVYLSTKAGSPADHAYYMEMRDRSGFDLDGHDQNDREPIAFSPGLLLVYTDESHGYGNVGTDDPPAQTPLDSQPQPGEIAPQLNDAAFTAGPDDSSFSDSGEGWTDNYTMPPDAGNWVLKFNCLSFDVLSMAGLEEGPAKPPGDLKGTVRFKLGKGCGKFNYGVKIKPAKRPAPAALARRFVL